MPFLCASAPLREIMVLLWGFDVHFDGAVVGDLFNEAAVVEPGFGVGVVEEVGIEEGGGGLDNEVVERLVVLLGDFGA